MPRWSRSLSISIGGPQLRGNDTPTVSLNLTPTIPRSGSSTVTLAVAWFGTKTRSGRPADRAESMARFSKLLLLGYLATAGRPSTTRICAWPQKCAYGFSVAVISTALPMQTESSAFPPLVANRRQPIGYVNCSAPRTGPTGRHQWNVNSWSPRPRATSLLIPSTLGSKIASSGSIVSAFVSAPSSGTCGTAGETVSTHSSTTTVSLVRTARGAARSRR